MHRAPAIAIGLLLASASATAEPRYTAAYAACMERAGGVTAAMIDCIGAEFAVQDRRLNAVYRQALAALPAPRRASLTKAQRAWLAFKKSECDFVFDPDGGSAARIAANDCVLRMTAERADRLDDVRRSAAGG
jgi:uncharacterized protein YecT (DUF1311 family)